MALKLDLSKAYDHVEWGFLRAMMGKMRFDTRFVELILATVDSIRYKIGPGSHQLGLIVPERGICQGDPLSPNWFLIFAEGFSSLIRRFERDGRLRGYNSYVYCRANEKKTSNILHLLQLFEAASGQQVNFSMSSIFFSTNTPTDVRHQLYALLGMGMAGECSTYLGLPCTMGRNKDAILGFLKEKMHK
ncbi:uncharacterized protein LOC115717797 [Cannabis sativa]|uniref:uncharacterized protein LOC115717797 n=1 Tax=Cannabis sativa TaxID=3483 RepID=UPI0029CA67CE|nr:uncharacterized protein LOC115717797 [Cannabis sativa]